MIAINLFKIINLIKIILFLDKIIEFLLFILDSY